MKKNLNLTLYKSLLLCDFYFLKKNLFNLSLKKIYKINKFTSYYLLDILEMVKAFKSFILLAKFTLSQTKKIIFFQILNSLTYKIFQKYIKSSNALYFIVKNPLRLSKSQITKSTNLFCQIGDYASLKEQRNNNKKLTNLNFLLYARFQARKDWNSQGIYQVTSELNSIKKALFLLSLFKKVRAYFNRS